MPERNKHRVLSLDGGGTWSTIQVAALSRLYSPDVRGREVLRDFDYAVANSGGSIVLAGLLLNASLQEIQQRFYDPDVRSALFTPLGDWDGGPLFKFIRWVLGGPRFSTAKKREGLQALFNDFARANNIHSQTLDDLAAGVGGDFQFTIVGYDYRRDRAKYFRSNSQSVARSRGSSTQTVELVDAVHASSTAPVQFFDRPADSFNQTLKEELFWDGAIAGQNNPIVSGVIEALANGAERDKTVVLSIGTGGNAIPPGLVNDPPWEIDNRAKRALADLKKLSKAIIGDPPDHASFIAHMMLCNQLPTTDGPRNNSPVVRMNPMIAPLPNLEGGAAWLWPEGLQTDEQKKIITLDMAAIKPEDFKHVQQLASNWISGKIRNQPIRMGNNLACDLGDETFASAMARWNAIK